jgi:hypothetical protein
MWRNGNGLDGVHAGIIGDLAPPTPPDEAPFGSFDTPSHGATGIAGAIAVTGWALDDNEVISVKIYRDPVIGVGSARVYVGDAVFVEGARPDIESAYPDYPNNTRGGWGYMMLTNFLPNHGDGTYVIHAVAKDTVGQQVTLGSKTITCDNANATRPFGTIDTPSQGGTAAGTFRNWGWALTPMPNTIPHDGSTIEVWVDGVRVVTGVSAGLARPDIQAAFPGYNNTDTAVHYFDLDTTAYANGVHTIEWRAVDNMGNANGIGSRYFTISN